MEGKGLETVVFRPSPLPVKIKARYTRRVEIRTQLTLALISAMAALISAISWLSCSYFTSSRSLLRVDMISSLPRRASSLVAETSSLMAPISECRLDLLEDGYGSVLLIEQSGPACSASSLLTARFSSPSSMPRWRSPYRHIEPLPSSSCHRLLKS